MSKPRYPRTSLLVEMVAQIGRDSLVYGTVITAVFPLSLVSIGVQARFLSPAEFGQLAILFFWSGLMTVVLNLFFLRGVERLVWGGTEEGPAEDSQTEAEIPTPSRSAGRMLGVGLVLNAALALAGGVAVFAYAEPLARALLGNGELRHAVAWAGVSGALGAVWRLWTNVLRWERRPLAFGAAYLLRPTMALVIATALLVAGAGVTGAVAGTALGTLASLLVAAGASRRSASIRLDLGATKAIIRADLPLLAMVLGLSLLHSADVYLLSLVSNDTEVGLYRLASRLSSLVSYAVSAFLMAWAPMERTALAKATYAEHGFQRVRVAFTTYYLIGGMLLVLALSVFAEPLLSILAPSFNGAVPLVPATGAAFIFYGMLIVVARTGQFPRRYLVYGSATMTGALVQAVSAVLLAQPLGAYGVAVGTMIGASAAILIILVVARVAGTPPAFDVKRIAGLLAIGGCCYALGLPIAGSVKGAETALGVAAVVLFPLLLLATGVVPSSDRRQFAAIFRRALRLDGRSLQTGFLERVSRLPPLQQRVIVTLLRDREPLPRAAEMVKLTEEDLKRELVRGLAELCERTVTEEVEVALADLLLASYSVTDADARERRLIQSGAQADAVHALRAAYEDLRRTRRKLWLRLLTAPESHLRPGPWSIEEPDVEALEIVVRKGEGLDAAAAWLQKDTADVTVRVMRALRAIAGGEADDDPAKDALLLGFLLDRGVPSDRLWGAQVEPIDLHRLQLALSHVRNLPDAAWSALVGQPRRVETPPEPQPDVIQP